MIRCWTNNLIRHADRRHDVLSTVVDTRPSDPEADEPGFPVQPCHVYGVLPCKFFPGEKALHYMQLGVFSCSFPHLLQLSRELFILDL